MQFTTVGSFDVFCTHLQTNTWKYVLRERESKGTCPVAIRDKYSFVEENTKHHHWPVRRLWAFAR